MSELHKRAVCLNCIDGRVQMPVIEWIKKNYQADEVDKITEPGMDGFLADENNSLEDIKRKIGVSIDKNNASMLFIIGHYDCQGNPVDEDTHREHIRSAVKRLKKEFSGINIVGVWMNENWEGEPC